MLEEKTIDQTRGVSRRNFLAGTGAAVGALTAGGLFGFFTTKPASAAGEIPALGTWDFPATGLDVEKVRIGAAAAYLTGGGCCYGAARGLLDELIRTTGGEASVWNNIPKDMFKFGKGGALGWGTLCGALNGSLAVINMVAFKQYTKADGSKYWGYDKIGEPLIGWYTQQNFPFNTSYTATTIADNMPAYVLADATLKAKVEGLAENINESVANSPLCHASVSLWVATNNAIPGAPVATVNGGLKGKRCAKLTGDVAAQAAAYLNAWVPTKDNAAPAFPGAFAQPAATADCLDCHSGTGNNKYSKPKRDDEQGKMSCGYCHDDIAADATHGASLK